MFSKKEPQKKEPFNFAESYCIWVMYSMILRLLYRIMITIVKVCYGDNFVYIFLCEIIVNLLIFVQLIQQDV